MSLNLLPEIKNSPLYKTIRYDYKTLFFSKRFSKSYISNLDEFKYKFGFDKEVLVSLQFQTALKILDHHLMIQLTMPTYVKYILKCDIYHFFLKFVSNFKHSLKLHDLCKLHNIAGL